MPQAIPEILSNFRGTFVFIFCIYFYILVNPDIHLGHTEVRSNMGISIFFFLVWVHTRYIYRSSHVQRTIAQLRYSTPGQILCDIFMTLLKRKRYFTLKLR